MRRKEGAYERGEGMCQTEMVFGRFDSPKQNGPQARWDLCMFEFRIPKAKFLASLDDSNVFTS